MVTSDTISGVFLSLQKELELGAIWGPHSAPVSWKQLELSDLYFHNLSNGDDITDPEIGDNQMPNPYKVPTVPPTPSAPGSYYYPHFPVEACWETLPPHALPSW